MVVDTCKPGPGPKYDEKYCVGDIIDGIPYLKIVHSRPEAGLPPLDAWCYKKPCQNDGICHNTQEFTDYDCVCEDSWTGKNCETFIPCSTSPCKNNGTCVNFNDYSGYECECDKIHTGDLCETVIPCSGQNMCGARDCLPGEQPFRSFYTENQFEFRSETSFQPCYNNATCHNSADLLTYSCECSEQFTGPQCKIEIPCSSDPCQNSAVCVNSADYSTYNCECENTHTGDNCETQIPCEISEKCQNQGNCTNSNDFSDYTCTCPSTHTGANCETLIPCSQNPCNQEISAVCVNSADFLSYSCICPIDYTGDDCQKMKPCSRTSDNRFFPSHTSGPCLNNATCFDDVDYVEYVCDCTTGFTGVHCETAIPCESSPCENSGVCGNFEDFSGYSCECAEGFTGGDCEFLMGV